MVFFAFSFYVEKYWTYKHMLKLIIKLLIVAYKIWLFDYIWLLNYVGLCVN